LINNKTDILLIFIQEALLFQWFVFCDERISCAERTFTSFASASRTGVGIGLRKTPLQFPYACPEPFLPS